MTQKPGGRVRRLGLSDRRQEGSIRLIFPRALLDALRDRVSSSHSSLI